MKKTIFLFFIATILIAISAIFYYHPFGEKTNGMIMLIEFEKIEGILNWEKELNCRGLTALVKAQDNVIEEYPDVFKRLAEEGYEIAGGYDSAPFWDMPYEEQLGYMKEAQDLIYRITGKPMRVFGSRYFAYDENTLKAADELGIEYILARGTKGVEAAVYSPYEYKTKIISVSNVPFEEMGTGSLCDYSLWARGADPDSFKEMVKASLEKKSKNLILVSHAYLGGTRTEWWKSYLYALDSKYVSWKTFDSWIGTSDPISLPNTEIPVNREVKYTVPTPAKAIDEYEAVPGLEDLLQKEKNGEAVNPVCY